MLLPQPKSLPPAARAEQAVLLPTRTMAALPSARSRIGLLSAPSATGRRNMLKMFVISPYQSISRP